MSYNSCARCHTRSLICDKSNPCGHCATAAALGSNINTVCVYSLSSSDSSGIEEDIAASRTRIQTEGYIHLKTELRDTSGSMAKNLLRLLFENSSQIGFFLDRYRFEEAFLLPHPPGDIRRPAPALISASYLWATRLSQDQTMEQAYLQYTIQLLEAARNAPRHQSPVQIIQANVLLATYFFSEGYIFYGQVRLESAIKLMFKENLHRNRPASLLTTAQGYMEDWEKIHALWTVNDLDKQWSGALNTIPIVYPLEPADADQAILTPWPLEKDQYRAGRSVAIGTLFKTTILDYGWRGANEPIYIDTDLRTIESKVAVLWERSAALETFCKEYIRSGDRTQEEIRVFLAQYDSLVDLLTKAGEALPPNNRQTVERIEEDDTACRLAVVFTLIQASLLRLMELERQHNIRDQMERMWKIARSILDIAIGLAKRSQPPVFVNPIIGSAWEQPVHFLSTEIRYIARETRKDESDGLQVNDLAERKAFVKDAVEAMGQLATQSLLLNHYVNNIRSSVVYATSEHPEVLENYLNI